MQLKVVVFICGSGWFVGSSQTSRVMTDSKEPGVIIIRYYLLALSFWFCNISIFRNDYRHS